MISLLILSIISFVLGATLLLAPKQQLEKFNHYLNQNICADTKLYGSVLLVVGLFLLYTFLKHTWL